MDKKTDSMKMKHLVVFYDNWCPNCTRFKRFIERVDWLDLIEFKELRSPKDINKFSNINLELAKQQMATYSNQWYYGFISLYLISCRIPLLWTILPLFFLFKITGFGQYLYINLAVKRKIIPIHCDEKTCVI